jgi:ankyrin repeat protein
MAVATGNINAPINAQGQTQLHVAVNAGNLAEVNRLIQAGADVNKANNIGETPLWIASDKIHVQIVERLLAAPGIDVNKANADGYTPLHMASFSGELDIFERLLAAPGIDVNKAANDGTTSLHVAILEKNDSIEHLLAAPGIDVNKAKNNGNTPLFLASMVRNVNAVKSLLAVPGIDVNKANNKGVTPLDIARRKGYMEIVTLIEAKLLSDDINNQLIEAIVAKNVSEVDRLLKAGANPNARFTEHSNQAIILLLKGISISMYDGVSPLFVAAKQGNRDIVQLLINAGANLDKVGSFNSPLHVAIKSNHNEIVDLLIASGANVNIQEEFELTPLHIASSQGQLSIVDKLIKAGAQVDLLSVEGETALELAYSEDQDEVVRYLVVNAGVSPHKPNQAGVTPLFLTQKWKEYELAILFESFPRKPIIPINVGDKIAVPHISNKNELAYIYKLNAPNAEVVEIGPCRWEITESELTKFYNHIRTVLYGDKADNELQETLHYLFPSFYPEKEPITALSDTNSFRTKPELLGLLQLLNNDSLDIETRRLTLREICKLPLAKNDTRILEIIYLANQILKPLQIIKVKFLESDTYAFYQAYDCSRSQNLIQFISAPFIEGGDGPERDGIVPLLGFGVGTYKSILPDLYNLEQITEINSWTCHGLLSLYLGIPGIVQSVCTNPFVGNTKLWDHAEDMMKRQFEILYSASKTLETELTVYRGSPHFKPYPIRRHSIFASSKSGYVANTFARPGKAKIIKLPPGTRVLDISNINKKEKEVLIFPPATDSNLVIEPIEIRNNNKRNTYRFRNPTNGNRNLPRERRRTYRRASRKLRK